MIVLSNTARTMKGTFEIMRCATTRRVVADSRGKILNLLCENGFITPEEKQACKNIKGVPTDRNILIACYCCTLLPEVDLSYNNDAVHIDTVTKNEEIMTGSVEAVAQSLSSLNIERVWQNVRLFVSAHRRRLHKILLPVVVVEAKRRGDTRKPEDILSVLEGVLLSNDSELESRMQKSYDSMGAIPFKAYTTEEQTVFDYCSAYTLLGLLSGDGINNPVGSIIIGRAKEIITEYLNAITLDN